MVKGFFRAAACSPKVSVADCRTNSRNIIDMAVQTYKAGADLSVFPEMSVTAYTCADLFHNSALLEDAEQALLDIVEASARDFGHIVVVGAPIRVGDALYNCAVVITGGFVLCVVPKTYLPTYNEFYERRWWAPAPPTNTEAYVCGERVPFGTHVLVDISGVKVGIEICEDLWVPVPPSSLATMAGAEIIVNLSASDDLIGKYAYLKSLVSQQSARCMSGYVYASAGYGESSTDLVFDGKDLIAENGRILAEAERWQTEGHFVMADIDIEAIRRDRMHMGTFTDCARRMDVPEYTIVNTYVLADSQPSDLLRYIDPTPFVPPTDAAIAQRCGEITSIQVAGLAKRLDFIHCSKLVVGISGGLDSTLALLVAVHAFDKLGLDRKGIIGVTMPGFGTTGRTYNNAVQLMHQLGVTIREVPISEAVSLHFRDIGHDPQVHDVTYENAQARQRTYLLMDIANQEGGIVLGTGDLSELALGWATYNGDHMSMYGVNAGVPKTLVKYLVRYFAESTDDDACRNTLLDIIDTPISPELIPADAEDKITQKTEDLVGPYELHDFFLYYTLRYGYSPERIGYLARHAFFGRYTEETIDKWLSVFVRRFFQQQFKRSCMPDGPKVGSVCLSPRGDWRMPSDAVMFKNVNDALDFEKNSKKQ